MIETKRLTLERPNAMIIEPLIHFYTSHRSAMAGGDVSFSEAVTRAYAVLGHWVHRDYGLFSVLKKDDKSLVGMAGPYFPPGRPETEVGWILFDGYEGEGYATEAASASVQYAKNTLMWREVVHYIDMKNVRSLAVADRIGAVLDQEANQPKPEQPCLVYRQPK